MNQKNKGKLVVIEGADGTGKETQTKILRDKLRTLGYEVETIDFPRKDSFFGKLIYEALAGKYGDFKSLHAKLAAPYWAADRALASAQIQSWLDDGKIVIADRYVSANQIHQGGKIADPVEREAFMKWLDQMEHGEFKIPRPDIVFLLDLPYEVSVSLMKERAAKSNDSRQNEKSSDQHESSPEHQVAARRAAIEMLSDKNWVQIKCSDDGISILPRETIHDRILPRCLELLQT